MIFNTHFDISYNINQFLEVGELLSLFNTQNCSEDIQILRTHRIYTLLSSKYRIDFKNLSWKVLSWTHMDNRYLTKRRLNNLLKYFKRINIIYTNIPIYEKKEKELLNTTVNLSMTRFIRKVNKNNIDNVIVNKLIRKFKKSILYSQ
tara:strand:+ start:4588 stop:5028 length:441 start_codon:yes stop_codon:yes gene_type:complete